MRLPLWRKILRELCLSRFLNIEDNQSREILQISKDSQADNRNFLQAIQLSQ